VNRWDPVSDHRNGNCSEWAARFNSPGGAAVAPICSERPPTDMRDKHSKQSAAKARNWFRQRGTRLLFFRHNFELFRNFNRSVVYLNITSACELLQAMCIQHYPTPTIQTVGNRLRLQSSAIRIFRPRASCPINIRNFNPASGSHGISEAMASRALRAKLGASSMPAEHVDQVGPITTNGVQQQTIAAGSCLFKFPTPNPTQCGQRLSRRTST